MTDAKTFDQVLYTEYEHEQVFAQKLARALAAGNRLEELTQIARGLGAEPGIAPQLARIALETEKQTAITAEDYLVSTMHLLDTESSLSALELNTIGGYPNVWYLAATWAHSAFRHAVTFARRVLLRRY